MFLPVIGGTIQVFFYGVALIWPSFILGVLITFILVENQRMIRDSLTGLMTRGQFEAYLAYRIRRPIPFGVIMMDINYFKEINDRFGHSEGDQALQPLSA